MKRAVGTLFGLFVAGLLAVLLPAGAAAASLQPIGNFEKPIYVTSDPGNAERALRRPARRADRQSSKTGCATEFADLRSVVGCCDGEQGLLSIALAPDFDSSGRLFVDYTDKAAPGAIHIAELRASGATAPISTLRNLLTIPHTAADNHYGGQLQFGPEGLLYISTGDGGGSNDEPQQRPEQGQPARQAPAPRRQPQQRPGIHRPRPATPSPATGGAVLDDLQPTACATPSASPSTASTTTW